MPPSTTTTTAPPPLAIRAWLRFDVVSRVVEEISPRTVLEIGCGQGALGARLASRVDYLGCEPDAASHAVAAERVQAQGGTVLHGVEQDVQPGRTFDLVCAFEVLEHLEDDRSALEQWVRRVRPGGHLLLSVPAHQERFGPMDTLVGHYRRYSPEQLETLLRESGLVEVRSTLYGWPLAYALEGVRNRLDARRLARAGQATAEELSAASGRTFQPPDARVGKVVEVATVPFRWLQRRRSRTGTGLVVVGRRPGDSG